MLYLAHINARGNIYPWIMTHNGSSLPNKLNIHYIVSLYEIFLLHFHMHAMKATLLWNYNADVAMAIFSQRFQA